MQSKWFCVRKVFSASLWLFLPASLLLISRISSNAVLFRASPPNDSYDAMFVAAMAGIGLTSLWALYRKQGRVKGLQPTALPVDCSWFNAFDLFELLTCACLAITSFQARIPGSGLAWSLAFLALAAFSVAVAIEQRGAGFQERPKDKVLARLASACLIIFATAFVVGPVLQSWSGPPELYVRWHPFSVPAELVWRGVFLSFACGMFLTAIDPFGRNGLFLVALVLSGYLHAFEMVADQLWSAHMKGMNGNPEHLYGDILGWFLIASAALLFLSLRRFITPRRDLEGTCGGDLLR